MRTLVLIGWAALVGALISNVVGQFDAGQLNWTSDFISTYAAMAPLGGFITASMLLSAASFLIVGILVSKYEVLGTNGFAHFVPALCGAAAAGLITLSHFKETERTWALLKQAGFWAIREQSFHDAGLLIFFYSALLLVMLIGVLAVVRYAGALNRVLGGAIFGMGPASFLFMSTHWPGHLGFSGPTWGLRQRAALFCLWLAAALLLTLVSRQTNASQPRATARTQ